MSHDLEPLDPAKGAWDTKEMGRRRFLEVTFWSVTSVVTVGVVGSGGRFLVGNSLEPRTANWVQIGKIAELKVGAVNRVNYAMKATDAWREVEQKGALYAYTADGASYTVLDGSCTHLGCIVQWAASENRFRCPCHAAEFTREGEVMSGPPPKALGRLETKIQDGALFARI
ncbi:MAG TPA: Rieske (2Fe-2S) protein [Thermoflexales bacterium]|jgi:Rieske Fe-S protein|nr:Rieske (2Fe-2S) protein [Anaerolineae bacterium]HQV27609.1 Rieske (2Fe-2S) protein [Thermoflexales bacterium]HQX10200.1 Rieske (2Fe-2S) protein [Thermoflexales bacterium]HQY23943.1 Rieske (2Fe-2S) protein [Thermoflexales bacterium]HQZ52779.1 Rieske (2Fe-2S) protein [Thermoflexales bacterium]